MTRNTGLILVVAVLATLAGVLTGRALQEDPNQGPAAEGPEALVGQQRPPFTLGASDGQRVSADDFNGRVLLVNFWATWCAPCREEMPMLDALHEQYAPDGLAVVGIALDDVQRAREFADALDIDYTILVGAQDVMATGLAWGNRAGLLPYTVLVDRGGVVRWTYLGELKRDALLAQIEPLL
ncbi:MAG: TlpA disulfide reductase family protein [Xanthomonadales bacterium]|jgi:thiol-disulfide isomerase/thioredoxin|nr:TlpA disulfide reductase family protein [Xanthomonadales bacterium]